MSISDDARVRRDTRRKLLADNATLGRALLGPIPHLLLLRAPWNAMDVSPSSRCRFASGISKDIQTTSCGPVSHLASRVSKMRKATPVPRARSALPSLRRRTALGPRDLPELRARPSLAHQTLAAFDLDAPPPDGVHMPSLQLANCALGGSLPPGSGRHAHSDETSTASSSYAIGALERQRFEATHSCRSRSHTFH